MGDVTITESANAIVAGCNAVVAVNSTINFPEGKLEELIEQIRLLNENLSRLLAEGK